MVDPQQDVSANTVGSNAENNKSGSSLTHLRQKYLPESVPESTHSLERPSPSSSAGSQSPHGSFTTSTVSTPSSAKKKPPTTPLELASIWDANEATRASIWEADEVIRAFVDNHWSDHAEYIKVDCQLTLPSLLAIGRLPCGEGSRACRRLIRVPAIHEQVALSLWEYLVKEAQRDDTTEAAPPQYPSIGDDTITTDATLTPDQQKPGRRTLTTAINRLRSQRHQHQPTLTLTIPNIATNPPRPSCPFCSNHCIPPPAAPAQQHQHHHHHHSPQNQDHPETAFWQLPNAASTPRSPNLARNLSGDTLIELQSTRSWGGTEEDSTEDEEPSSRQEYSGYGWLALARGCVGALEAVGSDCVGGVVRVWGVVWGGLTGWWYPT